jgi:tetratricopeptide (TPR) repeat protein
VYSSDDGDDNESDTCTTETSHTTSTATVHNRGGGRGGCRSGASSSALSQQRHVREGGSGSAEWSWIQQVKATELALDHALRRRQDMFQPGAATSAELFCEVPYCCTLLGNLHFRRGGGGGGGGVVHCSPSSSYEIAEAYYLRAIQWCERYQHLVVPQGSIDAATSRIHLVLADANANLGAVMWTTGRVDLAATTLRHAFEGYERCRELTEVANTTRDGASPFTVDVRPPPNLDSRAASVWHQLGLARCLQGRHSEALECLQHALLLRKKREANVVLDRSDSAPVDAATASAAASAALVEVASTYDAMGKVLSCQGQWRQALHHHQQAAELLLAHAPRRALAVIQSIVRTCVHLRNESSRDALTASPASASSSSPTAMPGTDGERDLHDSIQDVKVWLDGLLWRLLPSGAEEDDFVTMLRREVPGSISVLVTQLGHPG